jgi:hypothetical protein
VDTDRDLPPLPPPSLPSPSFDPYTDSPYAADPSKRPPLPKLNTVALDLDEEELEMTTRYTDAEWARFIGEVERDVGASMVSGEGWKRAKGEVFYAVPKLGSPEFAKTIDHTLLKLEARGVQMDALCSEARVEGFAVRFPLCDG